MTTASGPTADAPAIAVAAPNPPSRRDLVLLWVIFIAVHVALAVKSIGHDSDVYVYRDWVLAGLHDGRWPVLHFDWVYPVGALLPMLAVSPWADTAMDYEIAWSALVIALNAVAVVVLVRTTPQGERGALWWLMGMVALGPVTLLRLDAITAPMVVVALAVASRHPRSAAAILALGTWIKVAPAAALVALATTARRSWRDVGLPAALVSVVIVAGALALGAGTAVAAFVGAQGSRGLQVESVAATPFSVARLWDLGLAARYDSDLNTYQVAGANTVAVTRMLDLALAAAVTALAWLTWRASRRVTAPGPTVAVRSVEVLLLGALALFLTTIVLNKVGSPQFISWLLPPVSVGVATFGWSARWRVPAVGVLVTALLTQFVYPMTYVRFIAAWPPAVIVSAVRNALLVALLVWAVAHLWRFR